MNSQLPQWLLSTSISLVISMVVGAGSYLLLRVLEGRLSDWAALVNCVGSLIMVVVVTAVLSPIITIVELVPSCLVGVIAANFHRKSGGASSNWGQAFLLMTFATLISGNIQLLLLFQLGPRYPAIVPDFGPLRDGFLWLFLNLFIVAAPVALTPFLMWAWKNSKLRPGIDRQLKEGEEL